MWLQPQAVKGVGTDKAAGHPFGCSSKICSLLMALGRAGRSPWWEQKVLGAVRGQEMAVISEYSAFFFPALVLSNRVEWRRLCWP